MSQGAAIAVLILIFVILAAGIAATIIMSKKKGFSVGFAILGFFIALAGLILYLVWKDSKPAEGKGAGLGAIIGVICSVLMMILETVIGVGAM